MATNPDRLRVTVRPQASQPAPWEKDPPIVAAPWEKDQPVPQQSVAGPSGVLGGLVRGVGNVKQLRDILFLQAPTMALDAAGRALGTDALSGPRRAAEQAITSTAAAQARIPANPAIAESVEAFNQAPGTLSGIVDAGGVLARNPAAIAELLAEMLPGAVLGGSAGGVGAKALASRLPAGIASKVAPALTGAGVGAGAEVALGLPSEVTSRVNQGVPVGEAVRTAALRTAASAPVAAAFGAALPFRPFKGKGARPLAGNVAAQMAIQGTGEIATEEAGARAIGEQVSGGERFLAFTIGALMAPLDMKILSALRKVTRQSEDATPDEIREEAIRQSVNDDKVAQAVAKVLIDAGYDPNKMELQDPQAVAERIMRARNKGVEEADPLPKGDDPDIREARTRQLRESFERRVERGLGETDRSPAKEIPTTDSIYEPIPPGASPEQIAAINRRNAARLRKAEADRKRQAEERERSQLPPDDPDYVDPLARTTARTPGPQPMSDDEEAAFYDDALARAMDFFRRPGVEPDNPVIRRMAEEMAERETQLERERRARAAAGQRDGRPDFVLEPEGLMRNTDQNQAGRDAYRARQEEVMGRMREDAKEDPDIEDILNSDIPVEDKIRAYEALKGTFDPEGPLPKAAEPLGARMRRAARAAAQPSNEATQGGPLTPEALREMRRNEREAAARRAKEQEQARQKARQDEAEAQVEDLIRRFLERQQAEQARKEEERRQREEQERARREEQERARREEQERARREEQERARREEQERARREEQERARREEQERARRDGGTRERERQQQREEAGDRRGDYSNSWEKFWSKAAEQADSAARQYDEFARKEEERAKRYEKMHNESKEKSYKDEADAAKERARSDRENAQKQREKAREYRQRAEEARREGEERARRQGGTRGQWDWRKQQQQQEEPDNKYGGSDTAPEQNADGTWRTTADGEYVAGKTGKPAVWSDLRQLARWLVRNRMSGDFEPATWGKNGYVAKRNPRSQNNQGKQKPPPGGGDGDKQTPPPGEDSNPRSGTGDGPGAASPRPRSEGRQQSPPPPPQEEATQTREPPKPEPEPEPQPEPEPKPKRPEGAQEFFGPDQRIEAREVKDDKVFTPDGGEEIDVTVAVVELDDLIPSNFDDGRVNPDYPAELQPRDRERAATEAQIVDIVSRFVPRFLDNTAKISDGAPMIGANGVVESGNGRTMALTRIYKRHPDKAKAYQDYLQSQGYPVDGMRQPVLVRIRRTPMTLEKLRKITIEANESEVMEMTAAERAAADASLLSTDILELWRGGEVNSAANREFVQAFIREVVSTSERSKMMNAEGGISLDGIRRIKAALLMRAYGDIDLVSALAEDPDNEFKAIGGALQDVAGLWALMREKAKAGYIPQAMDQTDALLEAVRLVRRSRQSGEKLGDILGQVDMFGSKRPPLTQGFLGLMFRDVENWKRPFGQARMAESFAFYVNEAMKAAAGPDMFGNPPPRPEDLTSAARAKATGGDGGAQSTMFQREPRGDEDGRRGPQSLADASEPETGGRGDQSPPANREAPVRGEGFVLGAEGRGGQPTRPISPGEKDFAKALMESWLANISEALKAFGVRAVMPKSGDPELQKIFDTADEGDRLPLLLQHIAENDPNPANRALAKGLAALLGNRVIPVTAQPLQRARGLTLKRALISQLGKSVAQQIVLNSSDGLGFNSETILHETIHALVSFKLGVLQEAVAGNRQAGDLTDAQAAAVDRLNNLFERLKAAFERMRRSNDLPAVMEQAGISLESVEELLAHSLTNPMFQALLKSIDLDGNALPPLPQFTKKDSVWSKFVDFVAGVIFPGQKTSWSFRTALDDVLDASNSVLGALATVDDLQAGRIAFRNIVTSSQRPGTRTGDATSYQREPGDGLRKFIDSVIDTAAIDRLAERAKGKSGASLGADIKAMLDKFGHGAASVAVSNDARLRAMARKFKSPTIEKLADMFADLPGSDRTIGETYHEAVSRRSRVKLNILADIFGDRFDDAKFGEEVRNVLVRGEAAKSASAEAKAAAEKLAAMLREILQYRREAGEDIGNITAGYFPRVLKQEAVAANPVEFKRKAATVYRRMGVPEPEKAASEWFAMVMREYQGVDGGLLAIRVPRSPASSSAKSRELIKLADDVLSDFYEKDTFTVLRSYIVGSARRAEYTRRFGEKGREGSAEREAWRKKHGTKTQLEVMNDQMAKEIQESGLPADKTADALATVDKVLRSNLGLMGTDLSRASSEVISMLHVWNQVGKLDRAVLANLMDLAQGFVRTGSVDQGLRVLLDGLYEFGRNVAGKDDSKWKRWAKEVGVVVADTFEQNLQARISAESLSEAGQRLSVKFYRATLQTQLNEAARTSATKAAVRFIRTLVDDLGEDAATARRARRYLGELGIEDVDAFAKWVQQSGISANAPPKVGGKIAMDPMEEQLIRAIYRFAGDVALAPNRAQRPAYASHPVGSLFYGLMSFLFAFKSRVLNRWGRLARASVKERDPMMLAPIAIGLPMLLGMTEIIDSYLRLGLFGSNRKDEETGSEKVLRLIDRSGLTGPLSPLVNAVSGIRYQRSVTDSLAGSIVGSIADGVNKMGALVANNSPKTNTAERAAAGAVYDLIVEPAIDAAAVSYLRAPYAGAVVILSGTRKGGELPSDRERFIEAVAGPESKKVRQR